MWNFASVNLMWVWREISVVKWVAWEQRWWDEGCVRWGLRGDSCEMSSMRGVMRDGCCEGWVVWEMNGVWDEWWGMGDFVCYIGSVSSGFFSLCCPSCLNAINANRAVLGPVIHLSHQWPMGPQLFGARREGKTQCRIDVATSCV